LMWAGYFFTCLDLCIVSFCILGSLDSLLDLSSFVGYVVDLL
jgi:hypothetical protein